MKQVKLLLHVSSLSNSLAAGGDSDLQLKQSLLYVSSLLNNLAAGDDLSFKSETVFENEEVRLTMSIANAQQTLC